MTLLSVNVNKVAVLRNSRGGNLPCVLEAARIAMAAGAGGITVHPRPDQRHIRPSDVRDLAKLVANRVEFNIEGNPFASARGEYPGLLALVKETRPTQVTLVPDSDGQITSDHGFNLLQDRERLLEPGREIELAQEVCALGALRLFQADSGFVKIAARILHVLIEKAAEQPLVEIVVVGDIAIALGDAVAAP